MKRAMLILPLLLAACNSSPTIKAENASVAEVTQKAREAIHIEPGQWTGQVEMLDIQLPGMPNLPPEARARMQAAMQASKGHSFTNCVTPEEAAAPKKDFFGPDSAMKCTYDHFSMQGGKIDSEMTCQHQGMTQHTRMSGSFTPTSYDVTGETTMSGGRMEGGGGKVHITAARTGACTGKENGSSG